MIADEIIQKNFVRSFPEKNKFLVLNETMKEKHIFFER